MTMPDFLPGNYILLPPPSCPSLPQLFFQHNVMYARLGILPTLTVKKASQRLLDAIVALADVSSVVMNLTMSQGNEIIVMLPVSPKNGQIYYSDKTTSYKIQTVLFVRENKKYTKAPLNKNDEVNGDVVCIVLAWCGGWWWPQQRQQRLSLSLQAPCPFLLSSFFFRSSRLKATVLSVQSKNLRG